MKSVILTGAVVLAAAGMLHAATPPLKPASAPANIMVDPELASSDFIEHCAGCHGVGGHSAPANLPELYNRVGWLMCTPESRAYLIHLPNVAHSRIKDNAELADMLNYMVFVVGGASAPAGTKPFTAEEVARERAHPLISGSLTAARAKYVDQAIRKCNAPLSLRLQYVGQKKG